MSSAALTARELRDAHPPAPDAAQALCLHCGLPVPRHRLEPDGTGYCCFGCRMVSSVARAGEQGGDTPGASPALLRLGLGIFLTMHIMAFNGLFLGGHVYGESASAASGPVRSLFAWLLMLLTSLVVALQGVPLALDVWGGRGGGWARRALSVQGLILLGVAASFALSVAHTLAGEGPLYYDTAAMILVLVTLGAYLDSRAKHGAAGALRARVADLPARARVLRDGAVVVIEDAQLRAGDELRLAQGETCPVDGVVIEGLMLINESALTGESLPREAAAGDRVLAGAVVVDGAASVRAERVGHDRVAAQVDALLRRVLAERPAIQGLADRVAAAFIPGVALLAVASLVYWTRAQGLERGLSVALSVLLISCPCALGLAAPLACFNALARAAHRGVLFKSAAALERASRVGRVAIDKTGTLTEPRLSLGRVWVDPGLDRDAVLRVAASLVGASTHPLALALAPILPMHAATLPGAAVSRPGLGVEGELDGRMWRLGSPRFAAGLGVSLPGAWTQPQGPVVLIFDSQAVAAAFEFQERARSDAARAIDRLRELGVDVTVITGDHAAAAARIAQPLGLPFVAGLLPHQKLEHVRGMGSTAGVVDVAGVAFVGDGVNDAPALAGAGLGMALGHGSELAQQAGDVCLWGDRLTGVADALAVGRDAMRRVRLNLLWAFGYNAVGLALAAGGALSPVFAAVGMVVSSLMIVATSRGAGADRWPDGETHA